MTDTTHEAFRPGSAHPDHWLDPETMERHQPPAWLTTLATHAWIQPGLSRVDLYRTAEDSCAPTGWALALSREPEDTGDGPDHITIEVDPSYGCGYADQSHDVNNPTVVCTDYQPTNPVNYTTADVENWINSCNNAATDPSIITSELRTYHPDPDLSNITEQFVAAMLPDRTELVNTLTATIGYQMHNLFTRGWNMSRTISTDHLTLGITMSWKTATPGSTPSPTPGRVKITAEAFNYRYNDPDSPDYRGNGTELVNRYTWTMNGNTVQTLHAPVPSGTLNFTTYHDQEARNKIRALVTSTDQAPWYARCRVPIWDAADDDITRYDY